MNAQFASKPREKFLSNGWCRYLYQSSWTGHELRFVCQKGINGTRSRIAQ